MDAAATLVQIENTQLVRRVEQTDLAYVFRHTLAQEAIYESLLKTRRAELHRRVAEAIESLCGNDLEANAAVLAMHYERASVDDRAFTYAALAGDAASRSYAIPEALFWYDRALRIASRSADTAWYSTIRQVYATKGRLLEVSGGHAAALDNYRSMISFAQGTGDVAMEADGLTRLITTEGILGNIPITDSKLQQALDLARRSGDQALIGRALWNLGLAIRFRKPAMAIDFLLQALDHARQTGLAELEGYVLADLAVETQFMGRWKSTKVYAEESLAIFRALDNKPMIANALGNLAEAHFARGDSAMARQCALEGMQISETIGNPWGIGYNEWVLLMLDVTAGEYDRAIQNGARIFEVSRGLGIPLFVGLTSAMLVPLYAETHQFGRAQELVDSAAQNLSFMNSDIWSGIAAGFSARLALAMGDPESARRHLTSALRGEEIGSANLWLMVFVGPVLAELALVEHHPKLAQSLGDTLIPRMDEQNLSIYSTEMRYWRARASHLMGDLAAARRDLEQARQLAAHAEYRHLLWRIDSELAQLAASQGDYTSASLALANARETVSIICAHISDPAMRQSYLARSDVRSIVASQFLTANS